MEVCERLVLARGKIPRWKVCRAVGIALNTLSMYETGKRIPRDNIKKKLADFYGKSVEELFY